MTLPEELQTFIIEALQQVRENPDHNLKPVTRFAIYKAFGPSNHNTNTWKYVEVEGYSRLVRDKSFVLSIADAALAWLAILTSRKVIPIWLQAEIENIKDNRYSRDPLEMLYVAQNIMHGKVDVDEAMEDLNQKFYMGGAGLETITSLKVFNANFAAYLALQVALLGFPVSELSVDNEEDDFVYPAVVAYAANEKDKYTSAQNPKETVIYNPHTCLEFWEWWLTKAIPQAWGLAQEQAENK